MIILENLKQFFFASVLFVTAVSVHWNFVGLNSNSIQRNGLAQANSQKQIQKQVELNVSKDKVAIASTARKINL